MSDAAKTLWNRHRTPEYGADVSFAESAAQATRQSLAFSKTWQECEELAERDYRSSSSLSFSEGRGGLSKTEWVRQRANQRFHCAKPKAAQARRQLQQLANAR